MKSQPFFKELHEAYSKYSAINNHLYEKYDVKRGLRNADGSGVMAGITKVCCVHGYVMSEGEKLPIEGELIYRGYNINELVNGTVKNKRFGFEEVSYLLLFGNLPNEKQLEMMNELIRDARKLPDYFIEDILMKSPSQNLMNMMSMAVLALYSYDEEPENMSVESEMMKAISIIAKLPAIMVAAFQIYRRTHNNESMIMHSTNADESLAETILSTLRDDRSYTREEALLLDLCLMIHAEHGGGNNSTFVCRTLTSSGTDAYSAYSAAIGSLKGPRHGGANAKVMEMLDYFKTNVKNWDNEDEVRDYLVQIIQKNAGDKSGLVYGMGHAVYTLSDPRTVILKDNAMNLAKGTEFEAEFKLLDIIERLTPEVFAEERGDIKQICANVDMYSGLVYKMLNIPMEMFTPLFACARMPGWCAHRMEESSTCKRIIRPAYKAVSKNRVYTDLKNR